MSKDKIKCFFGLHDGEYQRPISVGYIGFGGVLTKIACEDLYKCKRCSHEYRMPEGYEMDKMILNLKLDIAKKLKDSGDIDKAIEVLKI